MPHYPQQDPIKLAEGILQLLDEGGFVATYKYALMIALLDLCIEQKQKSGLEAQSFTTLQIAKKIVEIYWPQTKEFKQQPLRQNTKGQAVVLTRIIDAQRSLGKTTSLYKFKIENQKAYNKLVKAVEREYIINPIPRLQKVGKQRLNILYEIGWDENQKISKDDFDNTIRLYAGVADNLVILNNLIRPLLYRHWAKMVADINKLEDSRLEKFLFGFDRINTRNLLEGLRELQGGLCFYTGKKLTGGHEDIDHFIPWARYPDNGLANLVLADASVNRQKRDFLAGTQHLEKWLMRLSTTSEQTTIMHQIARDTKWPFELIKTYNVANSIYTKLPDHALLWQHGKNDFEKFEKPKIEHLFLTINLSQ
ncbi:MAG: hypothetical protein HQM16_08260 [Deltaproteobacteria bacterium]|nr:hypothetical protein [Deltaproteobacteria bacterium]